MSGGYTRVDRYGRQVVRRAVRSERVGVPPPRVAARPRGCDRFYSVHYFQLCQFKTQEALLLLSRLIELPSRALSLSLSAVKLPVLRLYYIILYRARATPVKFSFVFVGFFFFTHINYIYIDI